MSRSNQLRPSSRSNSFIRDKRGFSPLMNTTGGSCGDGGGSGVGDIDSVSGGEGSSLNPLSSQSSSPLSS